MMLSAPPAGPPGHVDGEEWTSLEPVERRLDDELSRPRPTVQHSGGSLCSQGW